MSETSKPVPARHPSPGDELPGGDVLSGGDADAAPDQREAMTGYTQEKTEEELAGAPGDDPREPSQQDGSSGQDAGSME